MSYFLFAVTGLLFVGLIGLRRRQFDFFSVYAVALNIYYLPLYFGVVKNNLSGVYVEPLPQVFFCFVIVNIVSSVILIINDLVVERRLPRTMGAGRVAMVNGGQESIYKIFVYVVFALFVICLCLSFSVLYVLRNLSSVLMIILTVSLVMHKGRALMCLVVCLHIVLVLLLHDRSTSAIAILAFFVLYSFKNLAPFILFRSWYFIGLVFSVIIFSVFKSLYSFIAVFGVLGGFVETYKRFDLRLLFGGMEGQSTQFILDQVIYNKFQVGTEFILASFMKILPMPSMIFEYGSTTFNDLFQSALFPSVKYGMAGNPWAESYAWAGYVGVLVMSLFYVFLIAFVNISYKSTGNNILRIFLAVVGAYVAFWMHRNSLGGLLSHVRNALYVFLLVYLSSQLMKDSIYGRRGGKVRSG